MVFIGIKCCLREFSKFRNLFGIYILNDTRLEWTQLILFWHHYTTSSVASNLTMVCDCISRNLVISFWTSLRNLYLDGSCSIFSMRKRPSIVLTRDRITYSQPVKPERWVLLIDPKMMEFTVSPCVLWPVRTNDTSTVYRSRCLWLDRN